jgi:hypothetical protein
MVQCHGHNATLRILIFEIDRFISDRQVGCDVFPSNGAQNWGQIQPDPSVHQSKSNVIYLGSDGAGQRPGDRTGPMRPRRKLELGN